MQPKISITIPVYNVGDKLKTCLKSVVNQTLTDIEIICVDDASTDNSPQILNEFAASDNRIVLIKHNKNKGTLVSRKDAVLRASGEYIMFLDADDYLELNACKVAYDAISREKVDILRYGVNIIANDKDSESVKNYELLHACSTMKTENGNILEVCGDNLLLWNKIIAAGVCKKGYQAVEDFYCTHGEDTYALLLIVSFCTSYAVIEDKIYNYSFGIGIANKTTRTAVEFASLAETAEVFRKIKKYYDDNNVFEYWEKEYNRILSSHLMNALNEIDIYVKQEEQPICLKMLMKEWGEDAVIRNLYILHRAKEKELINKINERNKVIKNREKELTNIRSSKRWKLINKVLFFG